MGKNGLRLIIDFGRYLHKRLMIYSFVSVQGIIVEKTKILDGTCTALLQNVV
jgi:hypothetical protein